MRARRCPNLECTVMSFRLPSALCRSLSARSVCLPRPSSRRLSKNSRAYRTFFTLYGDPELIPTLRVDGAQLAGSFGNLAHSPGKLLLCEQPDRPPPKGSFKGIRLVAPIAVEQPQRGIKQKPSKLFAFHGCLRGSQCSLAMAIQVLFQSCEFLLVMVRPERTKSFRHEDLIVAGRAELLPQPHKPDLQLAEV